MKHDKRQPVLAIVVMVLGALMGTACDKLKPPPPPIPAPKTDSLPPVQPPPAFTEVPRAASAVH